MWGMHGHSRARVRQRRGPRAWLGDGQATSLADLRPGVEGRVAYIGTDDGRRLEHLSSLGIVPDAVLRLLQKRPAAVVQVGETEVAIDFSIARQIYVRPLA